jgi:hypothetical protein
MKKLILLFGLLFVLILQNKVTAQLQGDNESVLFTAYLLGAYNLEIKDGGEQIATFQSANDYNLGVTEGAGIVPGYTTIGVEATGNWFLDIKAEDFLPSTGTGVIPINNLGIWCEASGAHQFGTEVSCSFQDADNALGIVNTDTRLIDLITDNSGNLDDNEFVLHWLMGTMQGGMNSTSMFFQLSNGDFSLGTYTTTVVLTMTEIP